MGASVLLMAVLIGARVILVVDVEPTLAGLVVLRHHRGSLCLAAFSQTTWCPWPRLLLDTPPRHVVESLEKISP